MYAEWKAKLLAHLRAMANRNVDQWLAWAGEQDMPNVEDDVDVASPDSRRSQQVVRSSPHPIGLQHYGLPMLVGGQLTPGKRARSDEGGRDVRTSDA